MVLVIENTGAEDEIGQFVKGLVVPGELEFDRKRL